MLDYLKQRMNPQRIVPFLGPSVYKQFFEASAFTVCKGIIVWGKRMVLTNIFTNSMAPCVNNFVRCRVPGRGAALVVVRAQRFSLPSIPRPPIGIRMVIFSPIFGVTFCVKISSAIWIRACKKRNLGCSIGRDASKNNAYDLLVPPAFSCATYGLGRGHTSCNHSRSSHP